MKKIKLIGVALVASIFGLTSCDAQEILNQIPFLNNMMPTTEKDEHHDVEENKDEENNNQEGENQQGQGEQGQGEQGQGEQGQGEQGQGEQGQGGENEKTTEVSFKLSNANSVTQQTVKVEFAKGSGSNAPAWYDNGLRLYAKNTLTVSSENAISKISFDWQKQGSKAFANCSASTGSYSHPSSPGEGTWAGSSNSVTFTLGDSGQLLLNTFKVTINGEIEGGGTETPPEVLYSVESVAADIGELLELELEEDEGVYGIALDFSEEGEDYSNTHAESSVLAPVCEYLVDYYMPEYLTVVDEIYYDVEDDYWEDESGDTVYGIYLDVEEVEVEIISYCYNDALVGAVYVYSIAE